ncbi:hypothetical protein IDVR_15090 [Intrasporangium sp. DVR]
MCSRQVLAQEGRVTTALPEQVVAQPVDEHDDSAPHLRHPEDVRSRIAADSEPVRD